MGDGEGGVCNSWEEGSGDGWVAEWVVGIVIIAQKHIAHSGAVRNSREKERKKKMV